MITIRLLDARRGLNLKCRELFRDEKIADSIYRYLCDGIEECEDAEPERKKGEWISGAENFNTNYSHECSQCGALIDMYHGGADDYFFCPICGAKMEV